MGSSSLQAEKAEPLRETIEGELQMVKAAAAQAQEEAERFQKAPGLRGRVKH